VVRLFHVVHIFIDSFDPLRWLDSRVVSVLDSGAEGPGFQIAAATLSGNSLGQSVHTHRASVQQAAKLVTAFLRVARVTAGLAESNDALKLSPLSTCAGFMTHVTYLQADCQKPGSPPEPHARQSSMGYLYLFYSIH